MTKIAFSLAPMVTLLHFTHPWFLGEEFWLRPGSPDVFLRHVERTRAFRRSRDSARAAAALEAVQRAAAGSANVMPVFIDAVDAGVAAVLAAAPGTSIIVAPKR